MKKSHDSGWASGAPTPAQLKEFFAQIERGRVTREKLQTFLRGETDEVGIEEQEEGWREFYQKFFGIELDLSSIRIPEKQLGFGRLIILAKELTLSKVYNVCAGHFSCWCYAGNLDKAIPHNNRSPADSTYAIWVRARVEADEELKNLSADQLKEQGIIGITLLERMLYELKYWSETSKHLDIQNVTFCSGSRDSNGHVPNASWDGVRFSLSWCSTVCHFGYLRSRAAVL